MNKKRTKAGTRLFISVFALFSVFSVLLGAADHAINDTVSVFSENTVDMPSFAVIGEFEKTEGNYTVPVSIGGIGLKNVSVSVYEETHLIPGGMPFGIKFTTDGILVIGTDGVMTQNGTSYPANDAGIKVKDMIKKVNGKNVNSSDGFTSAVESSDGVPIEIELLRDGLTINTTLTAVKSSSDGKYRAGLWVKDSTAGIGTVTYIDPESGSFGGLGHGVCDTETGVLMPLKSGNVCDVCISGIKKGTSGTPGELQGFFTNTETGTLFKNSVCGVFGSFSTLPKKLREPLPIGLKDTLKEGPATLICTTAENAPTVYEIVIVKINRDSGENKNFIVKVTDERLLEKTGGIVQGMSGSPIIQNGKLVGAVTHVLVNDPTKGYGIFIENMLSTAQAPMAKAS